jgi:hypothetical protein
MATRRSFTALVISTILYNRGRQHGSDRSIQEPTNCHRGSALTVYSTVVESVKHTLRYRWNPNGENFLAWQA